jgi:hypothetical protein
VYRGHQVVLLLPLLTLASPARVWSATASFDAPANSALEPTRHIVRAKVSESRAAQRERFATLGRQSCYAKKTCTRIVDRLRLATLFVRTSDSS